MSKIDKTKESIGYLKVIFSILIAIDVSLIAWLYQNFNNLNVMDTVVIFILSVLFIFAIIVVNKNILYKIDELEDI